MAVFRAFKAFRPAEKYQRLIPALPYDVMSSEEAREAVQGNPLSFLHVDRAEIDLPPGTSPYEKAVYEKAKENLLNLEKSGALVQDGAPCFYIYRQEMNGRVQTGLAGCASIDDYMNNVIKKHEKTLAKKEADRIRHVSVTNANTGPIFLTYRKKDEISDLVNDFAARHRPVYNFEAAGALQTVWVIDDAAVISRLTELFESVKAFYIADGHHRCESAVRVGQMKRYENGGYTGSEAFNFFLAVAFPDSDLHIMDYNRVVKDLNGFTPAEFIGRISDAFEVKKQEKPFAPVKKHTFGMYLDSQWYSVSAKDKILQDLDLVDSLDVSVLQNNLLDPVLGIKDPKNDDRIDFIGGIRGLGELEKRANSDMKLAFSMFPTTVEELMAIADAGEIMPPKSTWFEPKLLSGIFIHHLS